MAVYLSVIHADHICLLEIGGESYIDFRTQCVIMTLAGKGGSGGVH